jgi:hypothetical protein
MKILVKDTKPDRNWSVNDFYYTEVIINLNFERFKHIQGGEVPLSKTLDKKYEGMTTTANFVGLSIIDGYPKFEINTVVMDRELKIEEILL